MQAHDNYSLLLTFSLMIEQGVPGREIPPSSHCFGQDYSTVQFSTHQHKIKGIFDEPQIIKPPTIDRDFMRRTASQISMKGKAKYRMLIAAFPAFPAFHWHRRTSVGSRGLKHIDRLTFFAVS